MRLTRFDVPQNGNRASRGNNQQSRLDALNFVSAESQIGPRLACFGGPTYDSVLLLSKNIAWYAYILRPNNAARL